MSAAKTNRLVESTAILLACGMTIRLIAMLTLSWKLLPAVLLGALLADFLSGLVHWAADTFGSPSTPFFGPAIRCFREHHDDPYAITEHGFVETNGNNALMTLPILVLAFALGGVARGVVTAAALLLLFTNQFHRWAHGHEELVGEWVDGRFHIDAELRVRRTVPALVAALQKLRVLPSPDAHGAHHWPPYRTGYCITFGWLNAPLDALKLWRRLEGFFVIPDELEAHSESLLRDQFNAKHGIQARHIATMVQPMNTTWILRRLEAKFPHLSDMTVVEIGAGVGVFAVELAQRCKRVVAIEADPVFSRDFALRLYADKPANLTWIFDVAKPELAAKNGGMVPHADLVLVLTGSDEAGLEALAAEFGTEVVMPWQAWAGGRALVDCRSEEGPPWVAAGKENHAEARIE